MRKEANKLILSVFLLFIMGLLLMGASSCSLVRLLNSSYSGESTLKIRDVEIDEKELESIITFSQRMEKSYDISNEISSIADHLDNPFKPFYIEEETSIEKNILILEDIFSENEIEYCEIKFNDFTYILTLDDIFNNMYLVQSINDSSVVLLKGDDIMTLFIGEMVTD